MYIIYTVFAVSVILYIISQYSDGCKADIGHSPLERQTKSACSSYWGEHGEEEEEDSVN